MSSEMRDDPGTVNDHAPVPLSEELRIEAALTVSAQRARMLRMAESAERLERALLARTEAGADGAVAHIHDYGDRVRVVWDKPWGDFPVGTQFYTRPQDASGDVVLTGPGDHDDLPAFLEWVASEVVRRDTRAGNFAEGLAQSLRGRAHILRIVKNDAMQAKEAK